MCSKVNNSLLLMGGGGHCSAVIDSICIESYNKIGIIDKQSRLGEELSGVRFVGCDEDLNLLKAEYDSAFISLGSIGDWRRRRILLENIELYGFHVPIITHLNAIISKNSQISRGVFAGPGCIINAYAKIGEMCIINTGCIVEHDCNIQSYVHIAPGAVLCGGVSIGIGSHIGAGSVIKEGVTIGKNSVIGIGSIVTSSVPDNVIAFGNPCKVIKHR